ncbi:hypothetical protein ACLMJK_004528 [Lecanora helva]
MQISLFTSLLTLLSFSTALSPTKLIYQTAVGNWYENLAVRPCGSILITSVTAPNLYSIDPNAPNPQPTLLHTFPSAVWTVGITETTPDTYYVVVANGSARTGGVLGTQRLYSVKYTGQNAAPKFELAATVGQALFLNGLTTLNERTVLAADSQRGLVWAVDVVDGTSKVVVQDPLMAPTKDSPFIGINGIHIRNNHLYFSNGAQKILAKIAIRSDGTPVGPPATVVVSFKYGIDDFTLDFRGNIFAATSGGNTINEVQKNGKQFVVAGDLNSTELAQPTSAKFGRTKKDKGTLYVTTAGGLADPVQTKDGPQKVGAQLVAIDLKHK